MKAAVTGAAGFVGSHLVEALLRNGHSVVGLDRPGATMPTDFDGDDERFVFSTGDIRDEAFVRSKIPNSCDVVFHLAAVVGVTNYLDSPFDVVDVNVIGTRNALIAARTGGARFLLASTSEIYGKNPKVPWAEDDDRVLGGTQIDRWSYSTSKAAAEHLTLAAGGHHGIPVTVVRYFNAYGPRQAPMYVISNSIHRVLNGKPPLVYDSGNQTRCFTYIEDIVRGTIEAGTSPAAEGEVFNIGNNTESTIREAIEAVVNAADGRTEFQPFSTEEAFGETYQDIVRRVPDVSKALSVLGWQATTGLEDGVASTVEWAKAQPSWLADTRSVASDPTTTEISSSPP